MTVGPPDSASLPSGRPPDGSGPPGQDEEIFSFLRQVLPPRSAVGRILPLEGDASDRRYFRVLMSDPDADEPSSYILMKLARPWISEGHRVELPFVDVARHLAEKGLPVPYVHRDASREGFVLLEDAGDLTLQQCLRNCTGVKRKKTYEDAVDLLVRMQSEATSPSSRPCHALGFSFDPETFFRELCFFAEHAIEGLWRRSIHASDRKDLEAHFLRLCREVAGYRKVFTHRDYHSRNLMIHDGRIVMLDFQDARLGPYTYDLASLVLDSYVVIEPAEQEALLTYYEEACRKADLGYVRPEAFRPEFARTGLQRNLKAIGTFAYQSVARKVDRYLPFIPNTLRSIRRTLGSCPEYADMKRLLETYVEGLR